MNDLLILVDENDNEIGYGTKTDVHVNEQLHRAFSLFIYDKSSGNLLLHRRALTKYHSGGLWTNSCCSHPRKGEDLLTAVIRRTKEELGLDIESHRTNIVELGKFQYYKKYKGCAESEIDHVFLLIANEEPDISFDSDEIAEIKWLSIQEIKLWLKEAPEKFTAWFPNALAMVLESI